MSEWEVSVRDGRGNIRHARFFGVSTEEEAREVAVKFSGRWDGAEIVSLKRTEGVSLGETMSLTGVVTPP